MKKKIYFENLDGLRFMCFLFVFFFHSFHTEYDSIKNSGIYHFIEKDICGNGNIGVNIFFVLSGFLITFLLIEEKKMNGKINVINFWIRRILRIWPLYYLCVFFGFLIFPLLKTAFGQVPNETASIWYYITFLNNFDSIKHGEPDASTLGILWSVAIEEQFYFVWPLILAVLPIKKYWIAFSTVILISLVYRGLNDSYMIHEKHTLSCIGDMAIGAFGAWMINESEWFKSKITGFKKYQIGIIYLLFTFILFFRDEVLFSNETIRIFERSIIAVVILFIILEQTYSENSFFKMGKFKTISKLGIITYGLYCLHFVGILIAITITKKLGINTHLWQVLIIDTSLALVISIIISKLSYNYFEKPFLKLKDKFAYITK